MLPSTRIRTGRLVANSVKQFQFYRRYSASNHDNYEYSDVVIIGGGPAGLALASALGSSRIVRDSSSITVLEAGDFSKIQNWSSRSPDFSNRVSSLTNASQAFLKEIGVWKYVDETRTCPVEEMQVWDGISNARITFSTGESGQENFEAGMARLIENLNLQRGFLRQLRLQPQVRLMDKTKVKTITQGSESGSWPLVHLDNGMTLRARLLVGADGFNSPVRSFAQIPSFGWAYDNQAIVATMNIQQRGTYENPNTVAYQRFLPTGPIAFLPLSPTVSSLVWSTKPSLAKALLACEPSVLTTMINAAFRLPEISLRYLYNRILDAHSAGSPISYSDIQQESLWREKSHSINQTSAYASAAKEANSMGMPPIDSEEVPPLVTSLQTGTIASFPLRFNHAESYIGEGPGARTVLVGDAAHTIHPLAGQGLNMGLSDVECLARCIQNALLCGGDIGSYTSLLPYTQERYFENHALMGVVDKLHKLYSTDVEPIVWARSVGLEVLNELDSVKAAIMMTAGGRAKRLNNGVDLWNLAAMGVETMNASVNTVQSLGRALGGGLLEMLNSDKKTK